MKLKKEDLTGIPCDTLNKNKSGNYIIRKGFFYRMGMSEDKIVDKLKEKFPEVIIISKGEKYKSFVGGQSIAQGSHFYVEFNFNNPEAKK